MPRNGIVGVQVAPIEPDDLAALQQAIERDPKALLALAQRLVRALALRDIVGDGDEAGLTSQVDGHERRLDIAHLAGLGAYLRLDVDASSPFADCLDSPIAVGWVN